MSSDSLVPVFDLSFAAPAGELARVSPLTRRLIAPNPGAFTFTGTCSYIVGQGEVAIIDPGPAISCHINALLKTFAGEKLAAILVTHTHRDHSPAAGLLRERTGAPVIGCAPYAARADQAGHGLDASLSAAGSMMLLCALVALVTMRRARVRATAP